MGQDSKIGWTDHTFNPWWGCIKVSQGCKHCYAETWASRYGHDIWGPNKARRTFGKKHWAEPLKWHAAAVKQGRRARVFCSSMADVFEDHPDVVEERKKLWNLIDETPYLNWLVLTKRPEHIARMCPVRWGADPESGCFDDTTLFPQNVWIGTSVEDQAAADARIPALLQVPAQVRFLSCEPLLGPLILQGAAPYGDESAQMMRKYLYSVSPVDNRRIHWIIAGGESGPGARPMDEVWARSLRDQARAAQIAFFMKQMGGTRDKRDDLESIPTDLRIREFPA